MELDHKLVSELAVRPGAQAKLATRSTSATRTVWLAEGSDPQEAIADRLLETFKSDLETSQEMLYASSTWSVLVILQALDAAGKDGTIKHVLSGVNPQGCTVFAFKEPTAEELAHDFLWRCERRLPERGQIVIFNRSYYEEVLVARVHPELLTHERLPNPGDPDLFNARFEDINAFEQHLERSGTRVVKIFLHLSKDEQKRRFLERLDDPAKHWKFSSADLAERSHFDEYLRAYEQAITATSTSWAPWYVVPADHKHAARALVAGILAHTIDGLDLHYPETSDDERAELARARAALVDELS